MTLTLEQLLLPSEGCMPGLGNLGQVRAKRIWELKLYSGYFWKPTPSSLEISNKVISRLLENLGRRYPGSFFHEDPPTLAADNSSFSVDNTAC